LMPIHRPETVIRARINASSAAIAMVDLFALSIIPSSGGIDLM
jgi:hypothetical protein